MHIHNASNDDTCLQRHCIEQDRLEIDGFDKKQRRGGRLGFLVGVGGRLNLSSYGSSSDGLSSYGSPKRETSTSYTCGSDSSS